ncbi:lysozyme [Ralstonia mannitolilytica]|uniref:lysozyme n=1 Tax=Ralstonia mannitolilytica TaxID=105219 RepID=UPI0028F65F52|nr:lysozyme [Ralstonia mannitolilytica]CAJ0889036.1 Lysozyme RrrD [Ralstonia mannitolilytica]
MQRTSAVLITVSALTLAGIAGWESYRRTAYDDGVGVQTVGFGSTTHEDGRPVRPGDTMTPERAVLRLAQDANRLWREAAACIGEVPLAAHEAAAFQSLVYNIGPGAFCRSSLVKKLKQTPPDYAGACKEILRWTRAGGRELPGLVKRREAEYRQCTGETP